MKKPVDDRPLPPLAADPGGATGKAVWATGFGGLGIDSPRDMAAGASGDVYVVGYFDGETDFATGGKHKVSKSKQTISRHWESAADEAPDLKGAINYDGEKVRGVEIYVPNCTFSITAYYEPSQVTTNLMRELARKTPRFNSDNWLRFQGSLQSAQFGLPLTEGPKRRQQLGFRFDF